MYERKMDDAMKVVAIMRISGPMTAGFYQALARAAEAFLLCSDWTPEARLSILKYAMKELAGVGVVDTLRTDALAAVVAYWEV